LVIKRNLNLLASSIGLIIFGLNSFFEFIPFESQKINSLILMLLSTSNFVLLIRAVNKETNLK
tara:strand:+ start:317 stop:505 length:189 start_codon:yes stop_codon:yes gene_type:complete